MGWPFRVVVPALVAELGAVLALQGAAISPRVCLGERCALVSCGLDSGRNQRSPTCPGLSPGLFGAGPQDPHTPVAPDALLASYPQPLLLDLRAYSILY